MEDINALTDATRVNEKKLEENLSQRNLFLTNRFSLPPGYRFVPTDEELILFYLKNKVEGNAVPESKIYTVNIYDYNPNQLRVKFNLWEERYWYFFTPRERKYPNGNRPNRSTGDGYWKATGADKPILSPEKKIGVKKTLVYYIGKSPNGIKTNWIMHEFRVTDSTSENHPAKRLKFDDWVLCKMYEKKGDEDNSERDSLNVETSTLNENMETSMANLNPTLPSNEQYEKKGEEDNCERNSLKCYTNVETEVVNLNPTVSYTDQMKREVDLFQPHTLNPYYLSNPLPDLDLSSFPQFHYDTIDLLFYDP